MLFAVYAISIENPQVSVYIAVLTYVAMVFCPIQHILEVYHSFREDRHRSTVHQHGGCFPFSFVISKVMTSRENALLLYIFCGEHGNMERCTYKSFSMSSMKQTTTAMHM